MFLMEMHSLNQANIFEIRINFESTLIIVSTPQVIRVFNVQCSGPKSLV